jgi:hypothetical protein
LKSQMSVRTTRGYFHRRARYCCGGANTTREFSIVNEIFQKIFVHRPTLASRGRIALDSFQLPTLSRDRCVGFSGLPWLPRPIGAGGEISAMAYRVNGKNRVPLNFFGVEEKGRAPGAARGLRQRRGCLSLAVFLRRKSSLRQRRNRAPVLRGLTSCVLRKGALSRWATRCAWWQ